MNHKRTVRAVVAVTLVYSIVLALWITMVVGRTPPGTLPYQVGGLVAGFGAALGLAMLVAGRATKEQRRLMRHGVEGWATVGTLTRLDARTAELELEFTVPGSGVYYGTIVWNLTEDEAERYEPGSILAVRVDPAHRDRVLLLPRGESFD